MSISNSRSAFARFQAMRHSIHLGARPCCHLWTGKCNYTCTKAVRKACAVWKKTCWFFHSYHTRMKITNLTYMGCVLVQLCTYLRILPMDTYNRAYVGRYTYTYHHGRSSMSVCVCDVCLWSEHATWIDFTSLTTHTDAGKIMLHHQVFKGSYRLKR